MGLEPWTFNSCWHSLTGPLLKSYTKLRGQLKYFPQNCWSYVNQFDAFLPDLKICSPSGQSSKKGHTSIVMPRRETYCSLAGRRGRCQFPFTWKGKEYNTCIKIKDTGPKAWCPPARQHCSDECKFTGNTIIGGHIQPQI